MNAANILPLIDTSENLQKLFNDRDVDIIAQKLNQGLNDRANVLIKKKKLQNSTDKYNFDNHELRNTRKTINTQSSIAHETKDPEEARYLKNLKNQYSKLEIKKKSYEMKVLSQMRVKVHFIREDTDCKMPISIKTERKYTTCQRKIANLYANHLESKILLLTSGLPDRKSEAVAMFKKLRKRMEEDLTIKDIKCCDVCKIISKLKRSNSRGKNKLTNNMLKEIPKYVSLALPHLFNSMARS